MLNTTHSVLDLPDGAKIAYEILGTQHLSSCQPLVLIGGMSSRRTDWERLANSLSHASLSLWNSEALVFTEQGMGDSKLTPEKDERITIESLARDLLALLAHLQWKDLSLCGFSMGGVITQQLLFLPYHPTRPVNLPFRATHVLLAGTLCSTLKDPRYGLRINRNVPDRQLTLDEKREMARGTLESTFDPAWLANPMNFKRFQWWLERMISGGR
ncbi:hypothetical protein C0995_007218 [Termitomyces sp. Mi166|nr:hypothetical protein C0995_007218 [Termitomyces sp. Mi166\